MMWRHPTKMLGFTSHDAKWTVGSSIAHTKKCNILCFSMYGKFGQLHDDDKLFDYFSTIFKSFFKSLKIKGIF